jgi:hypothetical protein
MGSKRGGQIGKARAECMRDHRSRLYEREGRSKSSTARQPVQRWGEAMNPEVFRICGAQIPERVGLSATEKAARIRCLAINQIVWKAMGVVRLLRVSLRTGRVVILFRESAVQARQTRSSTCADQRFGPTWPPE